MNPALLELLWVLLPLAVLSGWFAGRRDRKNLRTPKDDGFSSRYFRGINFVINEQPDKAIEVFTRMLEVNSDTVEAHLALGSLFRRRGEVERAIRIHQNLIARPTLDLDQRALALCELALDYHKAGLLDRAENLFSELAEMPAHSEQALRMLMSIYEQEKEWDQALTCASRLASSASREMAPVMAQYCCELAEAALHEGLVQEAESHLARALRVDSACARASLLSGRLAAMAADWQRAIRLWQGIEKQDPVFLDEAIDDLVLAYHKLGDERGLFVYLSGVVQRVPAIRALQRLVELLHHQEGARVAEDFVVSRIQQQPSLPGLRSLLDLQLQHAAGTDLPRLQIIKESLERLAAEQSRYQCQSCGFRGQSLHWQCPACHSWVTVKPAVCSLTPHPATPGKDRSGMTRAGKARKRSH